MRIVAWNILHGGGRRTAEICLALAEWRPDVAVISEFRRNRGGCVRGALADLGLGFQSEPPAEATTDGRANALLLASREPIARVEWHGPRLAHAELCGPSGRLALLGAHMPERGARTRCADAWASLVTLSRTMACEDTLVIGDLNAGRPGADGPRLTRADGERMGRLASLGFVDVFRAHHGDAPAWSWRSTSGGAYRLDHALASASLAPRVRAVRYEQGVPGRGVSDHAPLLVEIDQPRSKAG